MGTRDMVLTPCGSRGTGENGERNNDGEYLGMRKRAHAIVYDLLIYISFTKRLDRFSCLRVFSGLSIEQGRRQKLCIESLMKWTYCNRS